MTAAVNFLLCAQRSMGPDIAGTGYNRDLTRTANCMVWYHQDVLRDDNNSFIETLPRGLLKTHLPGSSGIETKWVGQRTAVHGTDAPNISPFRGGAIFSRMTLGWVIDRPFTPIAL